MATRQTRNGSLRQAQVLEAAAWVFFDKGYAAATVQDLAEASGLLKGSLYYYIASKDKLLQQVVAAAHEEAWQFVTAAEESGDPVGDFLARYLTWAVSRPRHATLLLEKHPSVTGETADWLREVRGQYRDFLARVLATTRDAVEAQVSAEALLGFITAASRSTALTPASADSLGAMAAALAA